MTVPDKFFLKQQSGHSHSLILSHVYTLCNTELIGLCLLNKWGAAMVHQAYHAEGVQ